MSFNLETFLQPYAYFIPLFGSLAVVILCLPFFIREFVRASRYSLEQAHKKANTFYDSGYGCSRHHFGDFYGSEPLSRNYSRSFFITYGSSQHPLSLCSYPRFTPHLVREKED
jgi:hypothetical protein